MIAVEGNMVVCKLDEFVYTGEEWPTVTLPLCRNHNNSIGIVLDTERRDMFGTLPNGDRSGVGPDDERRQFAVFRSDDGAIPLPGIGNDVELGRQRDRRDP